MYSHEGRNNAEASGSAARQGGQEEPAAGPGVASDQHASRDSVVAGPNVASGQGGAVGQVGTVGIAGAASGQVGAAVASQGSTKTRWTKKRVQTERTSPKKGSQTKTAGRPRTRSRAALGDAIPTQSSAAGGDT